MTKIGALEAGGTKMVLGVYGDGDKLLDTKTIPTEKPETTIPEMIGYFKDAGIDALGIGSFGPLDLREGSPTYGSITTTPKLAWADRPLYEEFRRALRVPVGIDTDVNAAVLAEAKLGAAKGCGVAVYVTVGTGVGGGVWVNGKTVHGMLHPEVGHMLLRPVEGDPLPEGVCPYHKSCLEGLASGTAINKRLGRKANDLPDDHPVFVLEAKYLAQMCVNLITTLSPERIVLGGGVMSRSALFPMIREETLRLLGGYVRTRQIRDEGDPLTAGKYIVPPVLQPSSGLVGSYLLGLGALEESSRS